MNRWVQGPIPYSGNLGNLISMSSALRQQLRTARQNLKPAERLAKSKLIAVNLANYLPFRRIVRIAFYFSTPEEVDTTLAINVATELEKEIYLPVINRASWRGSPLLFHPYNPVSTALRNNRYGIPEPVCRMGECITGQELDMVCVPLVGFNRRCERLGMGGGYYDKTFEKEGFRKTQLVGLGFECQKAEFQSQDHDVPMQAVVTEDEVLESKLN